MTDFGVKSDIPVHKVISNARKGVIRRRGLGKFKVRLIYHGFKEYNQSLKYVMDQSCLIIKCPF